MEVCRFSLQNLQTRNTIVQNAHIWGGFNFKRKPMTSGMFFTKRNLLGFKKNVKIQFQNLPNSFTMKGMGVFLCLLILNIYCTIQYQNFQELLEVFHIWTTMNYDFNIFSIMKYITLSCIITNVRPPNDGDWLRTFLPMNQNRSRK